MSNLTIIPLIIKRSKNLTRFHSTFVTGEKSHSVNSRVLALFIKMTSFCYSSVKCLRCAENHLTRDCVLKKDVAVDQKKLKCANCGQGHLANSQQYEAYLARLNYVEQVKAAALERRVPATKKYVRVPLPTKNAWTTPRKFSNSSPNPAEAHMKSVSSHLAEEVAASQDPVPAPIPGDSQPSNYSDFFSLVSESVN
jgi:transcription elongation factor Elf1